jgi:uncharacterized damage-inducible protein DinB
LSVVVIDSNRTETLAHGWFLEQAAFCDVRNFGEIARRFFSFEREVNRKLQPEPWLRNTHTEIAAVPRAVIHALELAHEDLTTWCGGLTEEELHATPAGLPSVAFQLRHIAGSVDRLLTYAEGAELNTAQLEALKTEPTAHLLRAKLFEELSFALTHGISRVRNLGASPALLEQPRTVGRKSLPSIVGGLLVHVADHTQRHVGQAITTAKLVRGLGK